MSSGLAWLPEIVTLEDYGGNWDRYVEAVYGVFEDDFVTDKPMFEGRRLRLKSHPYFRGKEATFWHMVSEGANESERLPDLRRCERVCWVRPIIENVSDPSVKRWENERRGGRRVCLWLEERDYLVILARRSGYVLPWTAYPVVENHRKRKLQSEYEHYQKAGTAR